MESRLTTIDKNVNPQYAAGSPVLLGACALYFDNIDKRCIAQLKFKNLDSKTIVAMMVDIICVDVFGHEIETQSYQYLNLSEKQGAFFGSRNAILLNSGNIKKYHVCLRAVSFDNGTVMEPVSPMIFCPLPEAKQLELEGDLLEQYKRDLEKLNIKTKVKNRTQEADGLWQCVCGSWQKNGTACFECQAIHDHLIAIESIESLTENLIAYRREQENIRKDNILNDAKQRMTFETEKEFANAIRLLESIKEWKDADALILICQQKIIELQESARKDNILANAKRKMETDKVADYMDAIQLLDSIREWKDADELIYVCQQLISKIQETESEKEQIQKAEELKRNQEKTDGRVIWVSFFILILISILFVAAFVYKNELKYAYVKHTQYKAYNQLTHQFLQDLAEVGYKDSYKLYRELYQWEAEVLSITESKEKPKELRNQFSLGESIYIQIKLNGGAPNESVDLKYRVTKPDGKQIEGLFNGKWQNGTSGWLSISNTENEKTGTLKITFYVVGQLIDEIEIVLIDKIVEGEITDQASENRISKKETTNNKVCVECGITAKKTYRNPFSGEAEDYCNFHYKEIIDMMGKMESVVGKSKQSKHTCVQCSREGIHKYNSFTGQTEYYCTAHYEELQSMLKYLGL